MTGAEIKQFILSRGLKLWQVADKMGMTDGNFSRKLRKPFSDAEIDKVKKIVSELSETARA